MSGMPKVKQRARLERMLVGGFFDGHRVWCDSATEVLDLPWLPDEDDHRTNVSYKYFLRVIDFAGRDIAAFVNDKLLSNEALRERLRHFGALRPGSFNRWIATEEQNA